MEKKVESEVICAANASTSRRAAWLDRIPSSISTSLEFRRPARSSVYLEKFLEGYRTYVSFVEDDKVMYTDIEASVNYLREVQLDLPEELLEFKDYSPVTGS